MLRNLKEDEILRSLIASKALLHRMGQKKIENRDKAKSVMADRWSSHVSS